ncbi:MAG: hypothetical protein AAB907_02545, partial [Patescibacteria group bacterium]
MKKRIFVRAPSLVMAGYGELSRFALRALRTKEDMFDIYLESVNWGKTGWISEDAEESAWIDSLIKKTAEAGEQGNLTFDMSLQITIPNEWKKLATINIGYTAGIETNLISTAWFDPSMAMDKIVVCSEHAKLVLQNSLFQSKQTQQVVRITTPVDVVYFPVRNIGKKEIELNLKSDFNFLSVVQWGPRKNLEQTVISFVEEFKAEPDVGLVLKMNIVNNSIIDQFQCKKQLANLLEKFPDRKCKVYLLHGSLTTEETNWLYTHPKIKAYYSLTHGEGFGLGAFEAAYNELPVIITDWSAPKEFLTIKDEDGAEKKLYAKVDYELRPVEPKAVWPG